MELNIPKRKKKISRLVFQSSLALCIVQVGEDVTESCYKSYHNTATHIGGERYSIRDDGTVFSSSPNYYILRPEVVESYFYLWRLTKEQKYRDWAWEAAQVDTTVYFSYTVLFI